MPEPLAAQLESILGVTPRRITPLIGGMIGQVYRVDLPDHTQIVAKAAASADSRLNLEGYMLAYLKEHSALPVPSVIHNSESLLIMDLVEGDSQFHSAAQRHAAELLAALHTIPSDHYGLERDTLIGGLHQPNPHSETWIDFFRDHRLFYMAGEALSAGQLPGSFLPRIHQFGQHLSEWLDEPEYPSLIHGDVWTTNVLASGERITAFLDPAIYYAHPEIELAFITLFNTFDSAFFARYNELSPIAPGFFEVRRDIYNLYPLLVHVRLFGGGYVASVDRVLSRFGF